MLEDHELVDGLAAVDATKVFDMFFEAISVISGPWLAVEVAWTLMKTLEGLIEALKGRLPR